jgi:transposase
MNPPDKAIVLSVDEKSQIQALDRTQPILPLRPGLPERQTHDYERHGTTTLFAALNVLEGTVIGVCQLRHRHQEFLRFLTRIDQSVDPGLDVHLVLDNYGTHEHPEVKKWLAKRPRYHVHFTPTSSSWLNQVERWFAEITRKRIRRDTFHSVRELVKVIRDYIRHYNCSSRRICSRIVCATPVAVGKSSLFSVISRYASSSDNGSIKSVCRRNWQDDSSVSFGSSY